jgi:hypothetical protein
MVIELRCPNRILFGVLDDRIIETKCKSARCGAKSGVVILHRFSADTGHLLETKVFQDPINLKDRSKSNAPRR